jgi:Rrf2 family transcriptional repressor of oqxAB
VTAFHSGRIREEVVSGEYLVYQTVMIDTRFSTALQIAIVVAVNEETASRCTSHTLANGLNTNPSFVRKMLLPLSEADILVSSVGNGGGVRLARPAGEIRLDEIYRSVMVETKILRARGNIPDRCPVTGNLERLSESLCREAECAVMNMLKSRTLESALHELRSYGYVPPRLEAVGST